MGAMQACGAGCHGRIAIQPLRSFLFAPGNHTRRVEKALSLQADAVILDLEDAVATAEKSTTRDAVIAALTRPRRLARIADHPALRSAEPLPWNCQPGELNRDAAFSARTRAS